VTSALSRRLVPAVMITDRRICLPVSLQAGSPPCPLGGFTFPTASPLHSIDVLRCRTIQPAFHRLRLRRPRLRSRLTLGRLTLPRNPQAFGVAGSHSYLATHSGIRSSVRSTCPPGQASPPTERSPTIPLLPAVRHLRAHHEGGIHSFGTMLEPRYVVGATPLDQ
jgi:hypothetical protein